MRMVSGLVPKVLSSLLLKLYALIYIKNLYLGTLAIWKSPIIEEFPDVPKDYKLICGVSMGYPTKHIVNSFNPGKKTILLQLI